MKKTERFIGACSKYIDKVGWATDIPVDQIKEKGYVKVENGFVVLSKEEYNEIKLYQSYIPEMKKAFDKVHNNAVKETAKEILYKLKETLIINNEENTEFFDYNFTLETIDEIANKYEVEE